MIYLTHPLLLMLTESWFSPPQRFNPYCYLAIGCFLAFGVLMYRAVGFCRHLALRFEKRFFVQLRSRKTVTT